VRVVDGGADGGEQAQAGAHVEARALRVREQRLAAHQLHGEERLRSARRGERARLEDLRDAGVLQAAQDLDLVLEAAQRARRRQGLAHQLEGN
jgi:hypothetical protein